MITSDTDAAVVSPSLPGLRENFAPTRAQSEQLAAPLCTEDQVVQTMPDVSPTKWHLAHTTWFFETFVLRPFLKDYEPFRQGFNALFNSYYHTAGTPFPRHRRGVLSRPTVDTINRYRSHVDEAIQRLFDMGDRSEEWTPLVEIGLHHERQHQELILTDIKHVLATHPMMPAYRKSDSTEDPPPLDHSPSPMQWLDIAGSTYEIGHDSLGFAFDNERPRHQVQLRDFQIASRPVSCGEYAEFIDHGGYRDPQWWLSDGWQWIEETAPTAPLYWRRQNDQWVTKTLDAVRPVDPAEPICHVNYFEADAYARWAGARLPTETEWEVASRIDEVKGNFLESRRFHPRPCTAGDPSRRDSHRYFGDVWEWTSSAYAPYPGFRRFAGSMSEYNGKFMCNQFVLRGGCCVTPRALLRRSYRNFFAPRSRWQFTGFRLAR